MLRYSEAGELSAGGRVVSMRSGAPGATAATSTPAKGMSVRADAAPMLIDLRGADDGPVLIREPQTAVPQQERRAVGRVLRLLGHLLDGLALAAPLVLSGLLLDRPIQLKVILLFSAVGMALLWPTARRGRLVAAPSERLLSIVGRVGGQRSRSSPAPTGGSCRTWPSCCRSSP